MKYCIVKNISLHRFGANQQLSLIQGVIRSGRSFQVLVLHFPYILNVRHFLG